MLTQSIPSMACCHASARDRSLAARMICIDTPLKCETLARKLRPISDFLYSASNGRQIITANAAQDST